LHEIVVVDDCSTDYTESVLEHLVSELEDVGITVKRIRTHKIQQPSRSRWLGTQVATAEIVAYADDDCLFSPYFLLGGVSSLLNRCEERVAAVGLPCYYRTQKPHRVVSLGQIGRLSIPDATWQGNFDAFPSEYLSESSFQINPTRIWPGFEVEWCLVGAVVAWRDAILEAQAFPEYQQDASLGEAFEFATSLRQAVYKIIFCPDPKFGVCHLKFGTRGRYPISYEECAAWIPTLAVHLEDLISLAKQERPGSGLRCSDEHFSFMETLGYFSFLLHYDVEAANIFAVRAYNDFVLSGRIYHRSITTAPENVEERYAIWRRAINAGVKLAEQYFGLAGDEILRAPLRELVATY
jgi:glycosyltransferase involved in cell wall biosynthesis